MSLLPLEAVCSTICAASTCTLMLVRWDTRRSRSNASPGAAPLLGHDDALGLLNDRHGLLLGLQPGKRRVVQDLPLRPARLDPGTCRP